MPKSHELSIETRALIVNYHRTDNREIAKILKVTHRIVDNVLNKKESDGSFCNKKRLARLKVTT